MSDGTLKAALIAELKTLARSFFVPAKWTLLILGGLLFLAIVVGHLLDDSAEKVSLPLLVVAALVYSIYVAAFPALAIGGVVLVWRIARAWILVPVVLVPSALVLSFWIFGGLLARETGGVFEAMVAAAGDHDWATAKIGPAARAGPIVLIIALPFLLFDLGAILLTPSVLWALFVLMLTLVFVVALALVPSGLASGVAIGIGYWRGFKRRHPELFREAR